MDVFSTAGKAKENLKWLRVLETLCMILSTKDNHLKKWVMSNSDAKARESFFYMCENLNGGQRTWGLDW